MALSHKQVAPSSPKIDLSSISKLPTLETNLGSIVKGKSISSRAILWNIENDENTEISKEAHIHTLKGSELSDLDLEQIATNFREDFGYKLENAWGEYKKCVCPDCNNMKSIQDIYGLEPKEYYPLSFLEKHYATESYCEDHPEYGPMEDFWDKKSIIAGLHKKLRMNPESVASLLRDNKKNVVGYAACYPASFKKAWQNEFEEFHSNLRSNYLEALQNAIGYPIDENSPMYVWNLVGIVAAFRQPKNTQNLIQSLGAIIDDSYKQLPILCEIDVTNPFTSFLMAIGGKILCNGENSNRLKLAIASTDIESVLHNIDEFYKGNPLLLKKAGYFRSLQKQNLLTQTPDKVLVEV